MCVWIVVDTCICVWLQADHGYVYMYVCVYIYVCVYMCISVSRLGQICMGVLSVCVAVCMCVWIVVDTCICVWLQADHGYVFNLRYVCVYIYMCISGSRLGQICLGVLSVCILYMNHPFTSPCGDGQIRLSYDLKDFNFIATLFRMSWRDTVGNIFMSNLWVAQRSGVGNIHLTRFC